jgi:hypothetical protein
MPAGDLTGSGKWYRPLCHILQMPTGSTKTLYAKHCFFGVDIQ